MALLTDITAIAAGSEFSLFLKNDGTVWSCGNNGGGALGDGTTLDRSTPVQVSEVSDIIAIAAGGLHSLFLKDDGSVWACGDNYYGQLGDGTSTGRNSPAQISSLSEITIIAGGDHHSLFLKNDESAWACGANDGGQLGEGTTTESHAPVQVLIDTQCSGVGIEEVNDRFSDLGVYPNPTADRIGLRMSSTSSRTLNVSLLDAHGALVKQFPAWSISGTDHRNWDISGLPAGAYFLQVSEAGKSWNRPFVKR